jgi:dimethylhistidine N-methyltransferase
MRLRHDEPSAARASDPTAPRVAESEAFAAAALAGLQRARKQLSPKWLYDTRGSQLFQDITTCEEYYLTRTEVALLREDAAMLFADFDRPVSAIEFGSASGEKTLLMLRHLHAIRRYVPIDVSQAALAMTDAFMQRHFPEVPVMPLLGDFGEPASLAERMQRIDGERLGFFPGSTLGNLAPAEACALLQGFRTTLGLHSLVLGLDTEKNPETLLAAYDDRAGITAAFNLNVLARMNRELGADFDLAAFRHEARWNGERRCMEMHIVSAQPQRVSLCGRTIAFDRNETIHTESSYKYAVPRALALFAAAGWRAERIARAPGDAFAIYRLNADPLA